MKITKRQLKRIIREEYSRLKRRGLIREGLLTESEDLAEKIWEDNGKGTDWGEQFLKILNRAQDWDHMEMIAEFTDGLEDTMREIDQDAKYLGLGTTAVATYIRLNYGNGNLDGWHGRNYIDHGWETP